MCACVCECVYTPVAVGVFGQFGKQKPAGRGKRREWGVRPIAGPGAQCQSNAPKAAPNSAVPILKLSTIHTRTHTHTHAHMHALDHFHFSPTHPHTHTHRESDAGCSLVETIKKLKPYAFAHFKPTTPYQPRPHRRTASRRSSSSV